MVDNVRVTQAVLEALADGDPALRVTQLALEALADGVPGLRATQAVLEALADGVPQLRVTQVVLEVMADDITPGETLQTSIVATTTSLDFGSHNLREILQTNIIASILTGDVMAAVELDLSTSIVATVSGTDRLNLGFGGSGLSGFSISTITDAQPEDDRFSSSLGP